MKKFSMVVVVLVLLTYSSFIKAQSACCGLDILTGMLFESGVSGGYGFQQFQATGLNDYIKVYNQNRPALTKQMDDFGFAHGWKIGANLFQIQNDNSLIGLNVFYQQTKEVNEATANVNNVTAKREYDLTLISYGFGMAYSYVINKHFDFKIIDLKFSWNKAKLVNKYTEGTNASTEEKLESPEASIGGMASTGLLYYPLPPYISLEIVGGYSYFTIDEMQFENGGSYLSKAENSNEKMENFIDGGGFFAFAQLNIAIPIFQ
jgi:hypothetical protein